ncbi:type I DNA topoisomerase [Candidatus Nomurabacteria bacterium]|nr:type I DNA topoisomerase [Candidatus Nomurabacteria bacterium]
MSKLVIVESPAKAKTIEKYLKELGNYRVVASVGHIRDLPKSNKKAIDIDGGFIPHYEISQGKEKVISDIKSLAKKADEVLLATDPDREGEAIAWHVAETIGLKNSSSKPVKRIVFNEITKEAVQEAINNPRSIDMDLKQAQEARRVLDRLFGYELSGLIWKKVRYGLSAGRVQSPALRILMEREREIRAFKPETFWVISAWLRKEKEKFLVTCTKEPRDRKEVDDILEKGKNGQWIVKDVKETKAKRSPRPPFITSTLQQTASTRLGFSPSRTMQVAQKLYEAGHITYMRTDSTNLSQNAFGQIKGIVEKDFGASYFQSRSYGKASKNAQEAHEAIRPSVLAKKVAGNNEDQKRLYKLIWARTVASQMIDAKMLRTKVITNITTGNIPDFTVSGQRILEEGWMKADPDARGEETEVPHVKANDVLELVEISDEEKQTQPPSRYTEAGLVKELEKRGIGRPSTYAAIIRTLNDRGYVEKEGKTLIPTDTGDVVSSFVEQNFENYISDSFTAEMENELDEIASGQREYIKTLQDFYTPFLKSVGEKESIDKLTTLGDADEKHVCPKCQSAMHIKLGRGGKFLSCSKYPECDGALTIEGHELKPDEPIGIDPETNEPIFVLTGRFGPYVQVGKLEKGSKVKPKRASIPKEKNPTEVTLEEALKYLSLPRKLGAHPDTGEEITANNGRFGPYIVHNGDFRSLKTDSVYEIDLKRALEILAEEKKTRKRKSK